MAVRSGMSVLQFCIRYEIIQGTPWLTYPISYKYTSLTVHAGCPMMVHRWVHISRDLKAFDLFQATGTIKLAEWRTGISLHPQ